MVQCEGIQRRTVAVEKNTRSLDFVRLTPHCTWDDSSILVAWILDNAFSYAPRARARRPRDSRRDPSTALRAGRRRYTLGRALECGGGDRYSM
jgi:hypothetical protein